VNAPCGDSSPRPVLSTTDGGSTWTSKTPPPACIGPAFACPRVTTCYASIGISPQPVEFFRTTDGGSSWQVRGTIASAHSLTCPSTTVCYVGGDYTIGRSTDGAQTWRISYFKEQCPTSEYICLQFGPIACPSDRICYAGGIDARKKGGGATVATTKNGGRTWGEHLFPRLGSIGYYPGPGLSCPSPRVCIALGSLGRIAKTTNGGDTWRVARILGPYLFDAIACPSATVCYAAGFLGRLVGSVDGGRTWRDLIPAIFVSGTSGTKQPLHTYSRWFTATQPWHVTLVNCGSAGDIDIYVQNTEKQTVAGPIHGPLNGYPPYGTDVQVTGRLRLDVVSPHCSSFSVRVDGVE
jgi:hypothetical protein